MAGCRSYLRGLSICVTVLLLVSGLVMIGVGFSSIDGSVAAAEVFGPLTVVLSLLGICAASLDLKPLLLVFSVLLLVEFVALMVVASPLVQIQTQMDGAVDDLFLNVTPLHRADGDIQRELDKLQTSDSCCGLRSFEDWENQLPASCFCTPHANLQSSWRNATSNGPCVSASGAGGGDDGRGGGVHATPSGTLWVHSEPCGPILKSHLGFPIKLRIGIISAFATITVASLALCLALGLERYWRTAPVEATVDDFNRVKYQPKPSLS